MTSEELEEQSYHALVEHHRDSLNDIIGGARSSDVFTVYTRRYLRKHGVLEFAAQGKRSVPTERARLVLGVE